MGTNKRVPLRGSEGQPIDEFEMDARARKRKTAKKLPFSKVGTLRFASSKRKPARWVCIDLNTHSSDREAMIGRLGLLTEHNYEELRRQFYPSFNRRQIEESLSSLISMAPREYSHDEHILKQALSMASTRALRELVVGENSIWKLPAPSALISVTGGAGPLHMTDKQKLVFRRGLLSAIKITNAWIMTGGNNTGVMQMVGRMLQESSVEVPCIGVAAWGVVAEKEDLIRKDNGRVHDYGGMTDLKAARPEDRRVAIDPNHSHFVFVDDGKEGESAFGCEIDLRAEFETCICTTSFGNDDEGHPLPTPPMVLLVVGGGPNTLENVLATLKQSRPVVVFIDSGGAAKHMSDWWTNLALRAKKSPAAKSDDVLLHSFDLVLPAGWTEDKYQDRLHQICELGKQPRGAMKMPQLSFFSTSDDVSAGNDLDMRILTSLLSNSEKAMEAVHLAIPWGEPTLIRNQLDELTVHDNRGLTKALEKALLLEKAPVVEVLVQYLAHAKGVWLSPLWHATLKNLELVTEPSWNATTPMREETRTRQGLDRRHWGMSRKRVGIEPIHDSTVDATVARHSDLRLIRMFEKSDVSRVYQLLSLVDYHRHIDARLHVAKMLSRGRASQARESSCHLRPTWTDVMLWAVASGEPDIARSLWKKTADPLRAAIMASRLAHNVLQEFRGELAGGREWAEHRKLYEKWAIGMLNAIEKRDQNDAAKLLLAIELTPSRVPIWPCSVADEATKSDISAPPLKFVSHPHCQKMLEGVFCGHFPRSSATIDPKCSFFDIFFAIISLTFLRRKEVNFKTKGMPDWERDNSGGGDDDDVVEDDDIIDDDEQVDALWMEGKWSALSPENDSADTPRLLFGFLRLLAVPKVKFLVHNLFAAAFVVVFSYTFCGLPWRAQPYMWHGEGTLDSSSISGWEFLVWVWVLTMMLEELRQMMESGRGYFSSVWNWVDLGHYLAIAASTILRVVVCLGAVHLEESPPNVGDPSITHSLSISGLRISHATRHDIMLACQSLYAISALLMWMRLIEQFSVERDVGVLRIILTLMISDNISAWFVITLCFTVGFGILFTMMMPGNVLRNDEQYRPFWGPFWGVLGYFDLEGVYEYHPAHTDGGLRHFPLLAPSYIVPFFVWAYSFFSTVVLVNLLIAQMSSTYERVKENSVKLWEFERAALIREYKDNKGLLPPPFNVLWHLYNFGRRICGHREPPFSRGFKWPHRRQGAADVYKIGRAARQEYLDTQARELASTTEHQIELLQRGQRVLEAEQRSQLEALTGRIERTFSRLEVKASVVQRSELDHRPTTNPIRAQLSTSLQHDGSQPQPFQTPLHEVARAALASLPPVPSLPQP